MEVVGQGRILDETAEHQQEAAAEAGHELALGGGIARLDPPDEVGDVAVRQHRSRSIRTARTNGDRTSTTWSQSERISRIGFRYRRRIHEVTGALTGRRRPFSVRPWLPIAPPPSASRPIPCCCRRGSRWGSSSWRRSSSCSPSASPSAGPMAASSRSGISGPTCAPGAFLANYARSLQAIYLWIGWRSLWMAALTTGARDRSSASPSPTTWRSWRRRAGRGCCWGWSWCRSGPAS